MAIAQECRLDLFKNPPDKRLLPRSNKHAIYDYLEKNYSWITNEATKKHIAFVANTDPIDRVTQKRQ